MDAEHQTLGEGLLRPAPTSRLAPPFSVSSAMIDVQWIQPVLMEQEIAPLPADTATCAPIAPLILSWTTSKTMPMMMMMMNGTDTCSSTTSNAMCRGRRDSDDHGCSAQGVLSQSSCTKESTAVTRTHNLGEFGQLAAQPETDDAHSSSTYMNVGHGDHNQTPSRRGMYYKKHQFHGQAGKLQNWSRLLKPEVMLSNEEESWPPLLLPAKKEGDSKESNCAAEPIVEHSGFDSSCISVKDQFRQSTTVLEGRAEHVMPYEQCWPSLEKLYKRTDPGSSYGVRRKKELRPLAQANTSKASDPGKTAFYKRSSMHLTPILLMVNKDFIVTSPLKENLMLTIALMGKDSTVSTTENIQAQIVEGSEIKRKVFMGQFKAFSSFLHFMLGHDATRVRTESNAGGTSTISECLSVEYFVRRFQAKDIVTEMEVEYCSFNWKKVDYICTLYGQRVGISVTRAMSFPDPKDFSSQMAYRLLHKKLFGLVVARHGVSKRHSFSQCILHVWCETQQTADLMRKEYNGVSQELDIANDVVMVLTVADGYHARPIFYESLLRNGSK